MTKVIHVHLIKKKKIIIWAVYLLSLTALQRKK